MTGFEPRTSGIGSDRSTNWATQPLIDCYVMTLPSVIDVHLNLLAICYLFIISGDFIINVH